MNDTKALPVEVPEWQCTVFVKTWTVAERAGFLDQFNGGDRGKLLGVLVASCLCDEHGNRLFNADDVQALEDKSAAVLDRLGLLALKHNGIDRTAVDEAKND